MASQALPTHLDAIPGPGPRRRSRVATRRPGELLHLEIQDSDSPCRHEPVPPECFGDDTGSLATRVDTTVYLDLESREAYVNSRDADDRGDLLFGVGHGGDLYGRRFVRRYDVEIWARKGDTERVAMDVRGEEPLGTVGVHNGIQSRVDGECVTWTLPPVESWPESDTVVPGEVSRESARNAECLLVPRESGSPAALVAGETSARIGEWTIDEDFRPGFEAGDTRPLFVLDAFGALHAVFQPERGGIFEYRRFVEEP